MNKFEEILDHVDAAVFNGDPLSDKDNLDHFRYMLKRWDKKADEWEEFINEFSNDNEPEHPNN